MRKNIFALLVLSLLIAGNTGGISALAAESAEQEVLSEENEEFEVIKNDEQNPVQNDDNNEEQTDEVSSDLAEDSSLEAESTETPETEKPIVSSEGLFVEEVRNSVDEESSDIIVPDICDEIQTMQTVTVDEDVAVVSYASGTEFLSRSIVSGSWQKIDRYWYYLNGEGEVLKGLVTIDGTKYLLDVVTGAMKINQWYQIGSSWYHSDVYGRVQTGWQKYDNKWYYLDPNYDGAMAKNRVITDEDGRHYVDSYGIMQINKNVTIDGKLYVVNGYGIILAGGWSQAGGKWYYADTEGVIKTGITEIDGIKYLLDLKTGEMKINQWYQIGSGWHHSDGYGRVQTGWQKYDNKWYYLDPENDGAMAKNQVITDEDGRHYVDGYGIMQINKSVTIGGNLYVVNGYGIIQTDGWCQAGGKWYYADAEGVLKTGISEIEGKRYLLDLKTGEMKINQWYQIGSGWYHSDGYGRVQTGWQKYGYDWYYLDPENDGAMAKGLITVGDTSYYLDGYGIMQKYITVTVNGTKYSIDGYGRAIKRAEKQPGVYLRSDIVALAQSLVGVQEGSSAHHRIVDTYNDRYPLPRGYAVTYSDAWCAVFTSYLGIDCGYTSIIPVECGCPQWITLAKDMGSWVETDSYSPREGDFILYDWQDSGSGDNRGTPDHIGIVERVSNGRISVIEGNYQDMVKRREIAVNGINIRGFVVPDYTD